MKTKTKKKKVAKKPRKRSRIIELVAECVIIVPFHSCDTEKENEARRKVAMRNIRETLREQFTFISITDDEMECSNRCRIRVKRGW